MKLNWAFLWVIVAILIGGVATLTFNYTLSYMTIPGAGWVAILFLAFELVIVLPLKWGFLFGISMAPLFLGTTSPKHFISIMLQFGILSFIAMVVQGIGILLYLYIPEHGYQPLDMTIPYVLQILLPVGTIILTLCTDYLLNKTLLHYA